MSNDKDKVYMAPKNWKAKRIYCGSYGHTERVATHKREGIFDKEHTVYMCYDCSIIGENSILKRLNVQELEVPGHDD